MTIRSSITGLPVQWKAFALGVLLGSAPAIHAEEYIVEIANFSFEPSTLEVKPGDTIVWHNRDIVPHTATALDQTWDSGAIAPGESGKLLVEASMQLEYFCAYHPSMLGRLSFMD